MGILVVMSMGTLGDVSELLPSLGHLVSRLVMANMTMSGEKFQNSNNEVVSTLMTIMHLGE